MPKTPLGKRIADATDEIRQSTEWQIRSRLEELDFSFRLYAANYTELKQWTSEVSAEDDESASQLLKLWNQKNRTQLDAHLEEASRRLHNFLASAKTLVDHTRNHVRDLYGRMAFESEYKQAVRSLLDASPVCKFVHELRNYNLHHRLPIIAGSLKIEFDPPGQVKTMTSNMALNVPALLKSHRWGRQAKQYLADAGEELHIHKLANDYMSAIQQFYEWQRSCELEIQKASLQRLQRRIDRVIRMERTFSGRGPRDPAPA